MQNFVFHNPTKILFGKSTLDSIGKETAQLGRKVLLVYGKKSLTASGAYQRIHHHLRKEGLEVVDFGGIRSNPLLSVVQEGIRCAKRENIEVIIGAGGGSVLDTAKAIGAGAVVDHDVWKFFIGKKGVKATLPVNTVPTLPAAGSEMNTGMVLTRDDTREKFGFGHRLLHPVTSILDPELTFTVPATHTVYGAVDIISHILEFYLTTKDDKTQVQQRFIEGLITTVMENCNRCLAESCDYDSRANLMWCAALALNGITASGLGRVGFPMHLLEHSLSGLYDTHHGAGLAATLPGWLSYYAELEPSRLARLGDRVFPEESLQLPDLENKADCFRRLFTEWLLSVGAPGSLEELGVPLDQLDSIASHTQGLAKIWRLREYSPAFMLDILNRCRTLPEAHR